MHDGTSVEEEQSAADAHVRDREPELPVVQRPVNRSRERRHREHPGQREQAVGEIVRVEPVRVESEAHPSPPHGHEETEVPQQSAERWIVDEV